MNKRQLALVDWMEVDEELDGRVHVDFLPLLFSIEEVQLFFFNTKVSIWATVLSK